MMRSQGEALENLYKGTLIEAAMDLSMRLTQEKNNRNTLASFLNRRFEPRVPFVE